VAVQDEAELKSGMGTVRKIDDTIPTLNFFEKRIKLCSVNSQIIVRVLHYYDFF